MLGSKKDSNGVLQSRVLCDLSSNWPKKNYLKLFARSTMCEP